MAVRIDEYKPKPLYGAWLMEMAPSQSDPINEVGALWSANRPVTAHALARAVKSAESRRAGARDKFDKAKFHSIAIKLSNMLARRGRMSTLTMVNPSASKRRAAARCRIAHKFKGHRRRFLRTQTHSKSYNASHATENNQFVRSLLGRFGKLVRKTSRKNPSAAWGKARKAARSKWLKARFNRNPKRDGSPTRGEIRKVKYAEYLRQLHKRGQEAHTELLRMLGRGAGQASHEIVHEAPALKAEKTETQKEHPGHTAPASEVTSEQRFIQDRLAEIKVLADDYQSQIDALGDSEENAAEAEMMMEELVKLGKQKKALKEKAASLGMVMTNPGRRRRMVRRGRRINPAAGRRYAKALHRIHQALQSLRRARRAARRR